MNSPKKEMNLYFKFTKTKAMKVKQSETIEDLKAVLQMYEGTSADLQELFLGGDHLKDDHRIMDYSIPKNSTIHVVCRESSPIITIYFKMPLNEKIIELPVREGDTIQKIKSMIQEKEGIHPCEFEIYSSGRLLENHRTVASLNIQREAILQMISNPKDTRSIHVETPKGRIIRVDVRWMHTVLDVKKIIESMINIDSRYMKLFINGTEQQLEDCKTLACYDIDEDEILTIRTPDVFQLSLKSNAGTNLTLDVTPSFTVRNVKELLFLRMGTAVNEQSISLAGQRLEDSRTLAAYNIDKTSILDLWTEWWNA